MSDTLPPSPAHPPGTSPVDASPEDEIARLRLATQLLQSQAEALGPAVLALALAPLQQRLNVLQAGVLPRLRQASVLFVDIVDSTRLLSQLDAEDSHSLLDQALGRFGALIEQQGGQVLRYTGDGLKAAFGMPEPAEDDAERAVRAALAVLAAAQDQAARVAASLGLAGFAVRAGIHTGPVAMGAGVEEAHTLVGATVHLAARMEQTAPAGTLRISHDTWRAVRGRFEMTPQPLLVVKGQDEPLQTYLVQGELAAEARTRGRGIDGVDTGLVGRDLDLAALLAAATAPVASACLVVGEAGLGKSRLRDELLLRLAGTAQDCLVASAWPQTVSQPFGLLHDLLWRHFRLDRCAQPGEALVQALHPLVSAADATVLACALGLVGPDHPRLQPHPPDRSALRQRSFDVATRWLRSLAARADGRPVRLVLDDLHWADDATLDLLDHWCGSHADLPLCLIGFTRPGPVAQRTTWTTQRVLQPLDAQASGQLVDRLLQRLEPAPPALRDALLERADGHPYYLEELLNMLIDQGVIDAQGPQWRLRSGLERLSSLPVTLSGVLQARLASLADASRRVLQQAAVIGPLFEQQVLAALDPAAATALPALAERGLVHADGEGRWRFHHQLLQQAAYDMVLKRDRADWHRQVAEHLAGRAHAPPYDTAEHFERAGLPEPAAQHYTRAALEGSARLAAPAQLRAAERALALAPQAAPALRWRLQRAALRGADDCQQADAVAQHLAAMRALADELDDDGLRTENEFQSILLTPGSVGLDQAAGVVALAERASQHGRAAPLARAYALQAWALCIHGQAAEARRIADQAIATAADAGELPPSQATTSAAIAAWKQGDLSAGLAHVQAGLAYDRARGDLSGEVVGLCNLAGMSRTLADLATWRHAVDEGLRMAQLQGNRRVMPLLLVRRGQLHLAEGDAAAGLDDIHKALSLLPADDRWFRITALLALGNAQLRTGTSARASFEAALDGAGSDAGMRAEAFEGLIRVALAEGNPAEAVAHAQGLLDALAAPEPGDVTERPGQLRAVADALAAAGDAQAARWRAQAHEELLAQAACISDPVARERFLAHGAAHLLPVAGGRV